MPFWVFGLHTKNRVHWHAPNSFLSEEDNICDTSGTRTRDPRVTSRARYHCATSPPLHINEWMLWDLMSIFVKFSQKNLIENVAVSPRQLPSHSIRKVQRKMLKSSVHRTINWWRPQEAKNENIEKVVLILVNRKSYCVTFICNERRVVLCARRIIPHAICNGIGTSPGDGARSVLISYRRAFAAWPDPK